MIEAQAGEVILDGSFIDIAMGAEVEWWIGVIPLIDRSGKVRLSMWSQ